MKKRILIFTAGAVLLTAVFLLVLAEYRLKGIRTELSKEEASNIAASAVSGGLDKTLDYYKINYDDVVNFTYGSDGSIKSLSVDIVTLNTFGNELGKNIDRDISQFKSDKIEIPISLLVGGELFSGIGPNIPFYITMKGASSSKFTDIFESAGVNQTRHKIMIETTVEMYVIFGGKVTTVSYTSNTCVAESIIVGVAPNTFARF